MSCITLTRRIILSAIVVLFLGLASGKLLAQTEKPLTWLDDLTFRNNASVESDEQRDTVVRIRTEVEAWLKFHPGTSVTLPEAPAQPWTPEQTHAQISALRETVAAIMKQSPARPFHLGVTQINVSESLPVLSPVASSISQADLIERDAVNVTKALDYLPGVEVQHASGPRNEAKYSIRGFSSSGQVPLYLDGIPIYVPYDGNIDLSRFLTSDVAEIQVSKGVSSPLLGPNGLGGAINLVTKEPTQRFEGEGMIGTGSGNGLISSLRLGTRASRYFAQGSADWAQADFVPLSGNFSYPAGGYAVLTPGNAANTLGNVGMPMTNEENNSHFRDEKWSGRVGWTPRGQDDYVFSYTNQKGQKGAPLYLGPYSNATFNRFWSWPYWNKDSYYFLSNTGIGEKSSIKFRVFYDQFRNSIDMWDNNTYSTMALSGSEHSKYDEHTDGASTEFVTRIHPRNVISASFFFKDDTHREVGIYPGRSPHPLVTPYLVDRDQQASIGLQDVVKLAPRLTATLGLSADHLDGLQAQTYNSALTALLPVTCLSSLTNSEFSGCTAHVWTYNPQTSIAYSFGESNSVFVTFADRSRFPLLKDSYSYKMGSALPNPDLKPEHSRNWNVGYSRSFAAKTLLTVELFHSSLRNAIEAWYVPDPTYTATHAGYLAATCPANDADPGASKYSPKTYQGQCSQSMNLGSEVHEGVEVEVRSTPLPRLTLDASYSYLTRDYAFNYADFSSLTVAPMTATSWSAFKNNVRAGLPKNKLVGNATIRLPHQATALVTARYEGGNDIVDTNGGSSALYYQAPVATFDIGAIIPVRKRFTVQAGVKNLLDRNYYYAAGYPEAGRNWYFNTRYSF